MLTETEVFCPFCGEEITIVVDCSEDVQIYTEDCFVCCRPIVMNIQCSDGEFISAQVHQENS